MPQTPIKIGKCSIKVQGKIIVKLAIKNLPKIGARAKIKRDGQFKVIGEVIEVIGSTRNPWVVISSPQSSFNMIQHEENIFTEERSQREKKKKKKRVRKQKRKRS
ncbi:MAG: hypothetical protein JSU57_01945 [Candidatus Heimdallarchaeota archaeon]|nr:MAG: hypothetical protein JSU57_01945 [Candidatus Heimdallarchaeota archaeon]